MARVLIWGAGGHAGVVCEILRANGKHEIVGFLDSLNPKVRALYGAQVLGGEENLRQLIEQELFTHAIVAIGDCRVRMKLAALLEKEGIALITAIHPRAIVSNTATIGAGTVIDAGAVLCAGTLIGNNVIINTSSSVNHDCFIEDGVHICPGTHIAGNVIVRSGTWIGIGSAVIERVEVGSNSFIGAGSVVVNDIPSNVVAYGAPAKVIRAR